jgi:hypothetical protein
VHSLSYTKDDKIVQASSGAQGVVYKSTQIRLTGFTCEGSACITYTQYQGKYSGWDSCSAPQDSTFNGAYLVKGAKLQQGDAVGYVTDDYAYIEYGGFSVDVVSGTFDTSQDIDVSYGDRVSSSWISGISGKITKPLSNSLSYSWGDVSVDDSGACTGDFIWFDAEVGGSDGTVAAYYYSSWGVYAYITSAGATCDTPTVSLAINELYSSPNAACSSLPKISVKCTAGIRDDSSTVVIKLTSDVKFVPQYYGGSSLTMGEGADAVDVGEPW